MAGRLSVIQTPAGDQSWVAGWREGSLDPFPSSGRRQSRPRIEPSRRGPANACRVVERPLPTPRDPRPAPSQFRGEPCSCIFAGIRLSKEPGPMKDLSIWMNGKLVPQAQAVLPVNSAAVFYATNVFEGLRAYWNAADDELYCFRLPEHFSRFRESMKMMRFTIPYSDVDLYEAVRQLLSGNEIREDVHMHMVAYVTGTGLDATTPTGLYINPRRRPRVEAGAGLKCCVSSCARTSDNAIPIRLKCGANYQNGRLATL